VSSRHSRVFGVLIVCFALAGTVVVGLPRNSLADERDKPAAPPLRARATDRKLLSPEQWSRLDRAVDRGLAFISKGQQSNGSFLSTFDGQPGVTSLCVMALLARGHQPKKGPYGPQIDRAIDYVLDMQDPTTGGIMSAPADEIAGNYSHAVSGVMLAEVYGMTDAKRHDRIRIAVMKALDYTRKQQTRPRRNPADRGGWRYLHPSPSGNDSDLSVTAWQLMFLRSARNADFNVPEQWVKDAMGYVHRTFDANERGFVYALAGFRHYCTRGMVGAGVVCLALGGEHQSETAKIAGNWILRSSFESYNRGSREEDRYHFGAFYCSQAMFQLGGDYWQRFFPSLLSTLAKAQHADGSWDPEWADDDSKFGSLLSTSFAVLALSPPYQMLPVYQR
jgi:hypothetical protein